MGKLIKNSLRFFLVTVGIVVLTSLGIDATDTLRGSNSALSSLVNNSLELTCPEGMVEVSLADKRYCIDAFENGTDDECAIRSPRSALDTKQNLSISECSSLSTGDVQPWTNVTFHQAKELCVRQGKRLPSSLEWFEAAIGTPDTAACNTDGDLLKTGENESCISPRGAYDMVGNVWEWVDGEVQDGIYEDRDLPDQGYVAEVDVAGMALVTSKEASQLYDSDYFWSTASGTFAVMRGGFYGSAEDAGVYSAHTRTSPSFSSAAIGFRCVMDL